MTHNILLVGGHGKVAQFLTPLLLARSWNVTSVIRTPEQTEAIEALGRNQPGRLNVLVKSLVDIKTETEAQEVINEVKPDWVVWSAGAGGKGGEKNTLAVDRDAAIAFTRASIKTTGVKKFLTVSYLASRRSRPSWWTSEDWEQAQKINHDVLPTYYQAKLAADEVLTVLAKERYEEEVRKGLPANELFCGISLRPGTLTDGKAGGVKVGKLGVGGKTSRATTAHAVLAALETQGTRGWIDVIDGDEDVKIAIEELTRKGTDSAEEEDLDIMKSNASL